MMENAIAWILLFPLFGALPLLFSEWATGKFAGR